MDRNTKAAIIIGDAQFCDPVETQDCDIYYYPINITEWELADEIEHLLEFYTNLIWPIWCPPHIRIEEVKKWVLPCGHADRKTGLAQCSIFCNNYDKGGCMYANEYMD